MAAGLPGCLTKLWIGSSTSAAVLLDIIDESLRSVATFVDGNGLKGTRSRYIQQVREGEKPAGGSISLYPRPVDLTTLLPLMTGGTIASNTITFGDTLPSTNIYKMLSPTSTNSFTYATAEIARWTLSCARGGMLRLDMDWIAKTEASSTSVGMPTVGLDVTTFPLMFHDTVLTLGASTYSPTGFSLTCDNGLLARFETSRTATDIYASDLNVFLSHNIPKSDISYDAFADATAAGTIALTYSGTSLTIVGTKFRYTNTTPIAASRAEIMYPLTAQAFADSTTARELVFTLDATP